jgi:phosphatidylglycerol---prolipoprotein diacylglyceryl transferase
VKRFLTWTSLATNLLQSSASSATAGFAPRTQKTISGIPACSYPVRKAEKPDHLCRSEFWTGSVRCCVPLVSFPVYLHFGFLRIHPHWFFEALAYIVSFRIYLLLRRRRGDAIPNADRWWVIAAAAVGATVGSKLLYWFEDPAATIRHLSDPAFLLGGKTIVGALIGALFAVEATKKYLGIGRRTGDLFALPLCVGIAIGRIGCFLTGLEDHTTGVATSLPWGVNFGDAVPRHPTQLYEIGFVLLLAALIVAASRRPHCEGDLFEIFTVGYFAFRLCVDSLKPDVRILAGLSSIQWACVFMLLYYAPDVLRRLGVKPLHRAKEAPNSKRLRLCVLNNRIFLTH